MKIQPMLAVSNTGAGGRQQVDPVQLLTSGEWCIQRKYDGIRAWQAPEGRLYSRTGQDITQQFPEIAGDRPRQWLDGEIVPLDLEDDFEHVAFRAAQHNVRKIASFATNQPCVLVAFDLPTELTLPHEERLARLTDLEPRAQAQSFVMSTVKDAADAFDNLWSNGLEGAVLKRRTSRYQPGKRSSNWIKIKFTKRYSCIAYGYSPGNGSRAHFGALLLAALDDNDIAVPVGRCGSGFRERQIPLIKDRLDAGEPLIVEIEALGWTSGGQLRHPVFRGVRTDVDILDCTMRQEA